MGFTQRKKRPHIYRDSAVPWPHETYLEKKAERAAAAASDKSGVSVVASLVRAKAKRTRKRPRK